MLTVERHKYIIDELSKKGKVTTLELSKALNVSPTTIRSDLNYLDQEKLVTKVHGGAIRPAEEIGSMNSYRTDMSSFFFKTREHVNEAEKNSIANKALEYIKDGQSIILDASSTCLNLAKKLDKFYRLTVVTNGIYTMLALKDMPNINVIMIGGMVTKNSGSIEGLLGHELLNNINADTAFVSAHGFSINEGLTDFNIYESDLKKRMIGRARSCVALLDYSKLEKSSTASFCKSKDIELLITDSSTSADIIEKYKNAKINVVI